MVVSHARGKWICRGVASQDVRADVDGYVSDASWVRLIRCAPNACMRPLAVAIAPAAAAAKREIRAHGRADVIPSVEVLTMTIPAR